MELNEILHTAMLHINTARSKHNAGKLEGCKICLRELHKLLDNNFAALETEGIAEPETVEAKIPAGTPEAKALAEAEAKAAEAPAETTEAEVPVTSEPEPAASET